MSIGAPSNPFSTCLIRAGAVPYFFEEGITLPSVLDRFDQSGRVGEVIGPHGTGKTTLVQELLAAWDQCGVVAQLATLHDGDGALPAVAWSRIDVLVIDGAEQLPWWRWRLVRWTARRAEVGLLVTSHRPLGLPLLHRTHSDLGIAKTVAAHVLSRSPELPSLVTADEVEAALDAEQGNLREALLRLYDLYEARFLDAQ